MANIVVPEYQAMLDQIVQSYGKKKEQADARAIGEAQRRGFINQRGTSDIEGMIRSSAVSPIAEAEAGALTDVYGRAAAETATDRRIKEGQAYGTAEREATQKYGTTERMSVQDYNKMMQEYMNQYNTTEAEKQRAYDERMLNLQRQWAASDAKKKSKDWWKDALGNAAGVAVGTYTGAKLAK